MPNVKVAIIGTGPAGYTAALYTSRAQLEPTVLAGLEIGGQLMYTTEVENFPGFEEGIRGPELMMTMGKQAQKFGAKVEYKFVSAVDLSQRPFKLWTNQPSAGFDVYKKGTQEEIDAAIEEIKQEDPEFTADSLIISTGATSIMLGIPGEDKFFGKGVSTCAVCDAAFYKDKVAYVVGGGDSAMEDALALSKFASHVTVVHRRDTFRASKIMADRVLNNEKINVMWNSSVTEVLGEDTVTGLRVETKAEDGTVSSQDLDADGLFIAIGHRPMTKVFQDQLQLDDHGYIVTRQSATAKGVALASNHIGDGDLLEFPTMTSVDGVFAAGDVVDVRYKQAITSAGQGAAAALDAERWLERHEE